jgi:hypothetical protein
MLNSLSPLKFTVEEGFETTEDAVPTGAHQQNKKCDSKFMET